MAYKIVGINNRGSGDRPYGFIYLAKGKREAGRVGFGAHRENPNSLAIWPCHETPDDINTVDVLRMRAALAEAFPRLVGKA